MYRTDEPFIVGRRVTVSYKGKSHGVELLGDGQQYVLLGRHHGEHQLGILGLPGLGAGGRIEADGRVYFPHSLGLLARFKAAFPAVPTKSGLMAGLGESDEEILTVMRDQRSAGVEMLTIGQYLQPSPHHLPVERYEPFVLALLSTQDRWAFNRGANPTEELWKMAALAGMGRPAFDKAVADTALRDWILKEAQADQERWKIDSTPSFVVNGQKYAGDMGFEAFLKLIPG